MKLNKVLLAAVLVTLSTRVYAGNGGSEPFDFTLLDVNARAVGIGGAYAPLANDSNALHYNPGGLGMVKRNEATVMHNVHVEGISQDYIAVALTQGVSLSVNYLRWSDTNRTTYASPDGTLDKYGISDLALAAGYGKTVLDNVSVGGSIKYLREGIDNKSISGVAFDVGGMATLPNVPGLSLGLAVQNIGPDVRFQGQNSSGPREKLPLAVRGGGAYAFEWYDLSHTVSVEISKERSQDTVGAVGWEGIVSKVLALRFGFNSRNSSDVGVTGGVGWVNPNYNIDYAVVPFGSLGVSHRISATVRWGGEAKASTASVKPLGSASK
jgi:hypothetical protein